MSELAKRKKVRAGHRGSATKLVTKLTEGLRDANLKKDRNWLKQGKVTLLEKMESLKSLDEQIVDLISEGEDDEEYIVQEIEESDNLRAEYHKVILDIDEALSHDCTTPHTPTSTTSTQQLSTISTAKLRARLPKLEVRKFDGTPHEWQEFWDAFTSAVDNNDALSKVDKFNYLRGLLEGPAKSSIAGFSLTEANYSTAVEQLTKRYGKRNTIQRSHISEMMQLQPVFSEKDTTRLRKMHDTLETHYRGLQALEVDEMSYSTIIVPSVMEKLPEQFRLTITRGEDFLDWNVKDLLNAFSSELTLRETHHSVMSTVRVKSPRETPTTAHALMLNQKRRECAFCLGDHPHEECKKIKDIKIRKTFIKKYGRCFRCLSKGHRARDCAFTIACQGCGEDHHSALCDKECKESAAASTTQSASHVTISPSSMHVGTGGRVALQTARGFVRGEKEGKVRVLFDAGSHRSFVTSSTVKVIRPSVVRQEWLGISTLGQKCEKAEIRDVVKLEIRPVAGEKAIVIEAYVVPKISSIQNERAELARKQYGHLKGLYFSDVCKGQKELEVDILIGADFLWSFQRGRIIRGKPDEPVAVETELGWVLSGPLKGPPAGEGSVMSFITQVEQMPLSEDFHRFWDLETVGVKEEQSEACESFSDSINFTGNRYSVKLPWKVGHPELPDNYNISLRRLKSQVRRLEKESELLEEYSSIIRQQLNAGIIERVIDLEKPGKVHYLPHQAVVRRDSSTTKLRIVYDASSKEKGKVSLNDCLHVGPSLNPLLYDILLRLRVSKIALVGDIEKAFLNIEVQEEDKDSLRFLWADDPSDLSKISVYRFCRVVFGVSSSPFLLNATLQHHIRGYTETDPGFAQKMLEGFYVDDLVTGGNDIEEVIQLYEKAKERMQSGGFKLRKWITNDEQVRGHITREEVGAQCEKGKDEISYAQTTVGVQMGSKGQKVLGLEWEREQDKIVFDLTAIHNKVSQEVSTKRNVLRALAGVFDPLGIISPITVSMKILFQKTCMSQLEWDQPLEGELKREMERWVKDLEEAQRIEISRCIYSHVKEEVLSCSLHGFGDASDKAYCAVIYMVYVTSTGTFVELLTSKTRVAPVKKLTIPRLELMSARILAQLMHTVKEALKSQKEIDKTTYWLDSMTALYWIMNRGEWKQFVRHRVEEILKLSCNKQWYHW
ncbi:MAG: hypothetical protein DSY43_03210 [Gammaproteobacteria bacterium]|nr:MAG: hypothetical protein DSY43_03210 [Gammaproteobacteria bacterium]